MQILLADDDLVARRMSSGLLKKSGHEVVLAGSGSEALAVLQEGSAPCVAILDWAMLGVNVGEVCKHIRAASERQYVYLVALTSEKEEDILQAFDAGFDDFVTKPISPAELSGRLLVARRMVELQQQLVLSSETLKVRSSHDVLTGLWNRAAILDLLGSEVNRAQRDNSSLTILMVDVDRFKRINETYGHPVGDRVLKHVAQNLTFSVRAGDWIGRYGGEEFLVIAPGCAPTGSLALAERVRRLVAVRPITIDGLQISITISVGVANSRDHGLDTLQLLKIADSAVYTAKRKGRNRVEVHEKLVDASGDSSAEGAAGSANNTNGERRISWAAVQLPPFPPVAAKALQLADQGDSPFSQLAALIASDPAFSSEVLSIVNSALLGLSSPVNSIAQALSLLGLERVRGLAVTVGLRNFLGSSMQHPVLRACWRHSLACAVIAEELAPSISLDVGAAYTGGVMHDIGRVALAVIHPQEYGKFLEEARSTPEELLLLEQKSFGVDHCEAGRRLIYEWGLPTEFVEIASQHHSRQENKRFDLPALIRWSCEAADVAGFTSVQHVSTRKYEQLLSELPERARSHFYLEPKELASKIEAKISSMLLPR